MITHDLNLLNGPWSLMNFFMYLIEIFDIENEIKDVDDLEKITYKLT